MVRSYLYQLIGILLRLIPNNASTNVSYESGDSLGQLPSSLKLTREILYHIAKHYQSPITVDSIAHAIGLSKSHLCRVFKQHTNQTIVHYINELRCQHALNLIKENVPLGQICESVGFSDYNYFSRVFKKNALAIHQSISFLNNYSFYIRLIEFILHLKPKARP